MNVKEQATQKFKEKILEFKKQLTELEAQIEERQKARKIAEDALDTRSNELASEIEKEETKLTQIKAQTNELRESAADEATRLQELTASAREEMKTITDETEATFEILHSARDSTATNNNNVSSSNNDQPPATSEAEEPASNDKTSQDIKDIETFDPKKQSNKQLQNDFKLVCAWYATKKDKAKEFKFSKEQLTELGTTVVKEIINRTKDGKMKHVFNAEAMKPTSRELFKNILKNLPKEEAERIQTIADAAAPDLPAFTLFMQSPEKLWTANANGSMIIKPRPHADDIISKRLFLTDKKKCYGIIQITDITEITNKEFESLGHAHQIEADQRKEWASTNPAWGREPLYAHHFVWITRFVTPKQIQLADPKQAQTEPTIYPEANYSFLGGPAGTPDIEDFPQIVVVPNFISITGSAAYQTREPRDVDLAIKAYDDELGMYVPIDAGLNLKLTRLIEKVYPGKNIHYVPSPGGPIFDHFALYDLMLVPKKEMLKTVINEPDFKQIGYDAQEDKPIKLFKFFKMLKPLTGRHKGEEYSIDSTIKVVEARREDWYKEGGIIVETKFDGIHAQATTDGKGKVIIFTEEGNDITDKLPGLVSDLKKIPFDCSICGEVELWDKQTHLPRQRITAVIHRNKLNEEEDKQVRMTIFDCVFHKGKDIHNHPFTERLRALGTIKESKHIKKSERRVAKNRSQLKAAMEYFSTKPGAEGSYLKRAGFLYEGDGATLDNIKHKCTYSLDAEVLKSNKVEGSNAWNYLCIVRDPRGRPVPVGKSYNTSIGRVDGEQPLKPGDILKVEVGNINKYFDEEKKRTWYSWWSGRPHMWRRDKKKPDNTRTVEKLVIESKGTSSNKPWPKRYEKDEDTQDTADARKPNPYLYMPDETKRWKGLLQAHTRGKSIHLDLRIQVKKNTKDNDELIGWTIFIPKGLSRVPKSFQDMKTLVNREIMPLIKATMKDPMKKFNCTTKLPEPIEWLGYSGEVEAREILPGTVGSTRFEKGFFYNIDEFEVEFGTNKPLYHEYFMDGKIMKGKIAVRKVENRKDWKKTPEGVMTWMMFATKEQLPYAISRRAVTKGWIPEPNSSALPREIRKRVPDKYKYWKISDKSERIKVRDALVDAIKANEVAIDEANQRILDAKAPASQFRLQEQTWKGQTVIRKGPSRTEFHLLLKYKIGSKEYTKDFITDDEPPATGVLMKATKGRWDAKDDIKPNTKLNTTKNTPSKIIIIDQGSFRWIDKDKTIMKLGGKTLKGIFHLPKEKGTDLRTLKPDRTGRAGTTRADKALIRQVAKTNSIHGTARILNTSEQTVRDCINEQDEQNNQDEQDDDGN